jgi:hypothetical protein
VTLSIGWNGSSCNFDTSAVTGAGNARLLLDSTSPVVGSLLSVGAGHTLAEVTSFYASYTGGGSPLPTWLTDVADVKVEEFTRANSEALLDLAAGTYAAVCFDSLAGYVVAGDSLVVP